ncbi:MAG TPA: PIN domain-containing protein [Thermoflexia bacterium]|nr:PIN domain-containing protein [Thermoflexia bacterium]
MRILIDTNVILDIILERQPFVEPASRLLETAQHADIVLYVTATTITDLYYIIRKAKGRVTALNFIVDLLQFMEVATVDKAIIRAALHSDIVDFEDAVQENAAKRQNIQVIITRNEADFQNSVLEIHNPESFLKSL